MYLHSRFEALYVILKLYAGNIYRYIFQFSLNSFSDFNLSSSESSWQSTASQEVISLKGA